MSRDRRFLLGVGAFAVGVAFVVVPGGDLALGRSLVVLVGVGALVQAVRLGRERRGSDAAWTETPDPERGATAPPPGDDADEVLSEFAGSRASGVRTRTRDALETIATEVLVRYAGYEPEAARERIADGTWTDEPHAAAFLGDANAPASSLRDRVRDRISGQSTIDRDVRHTVDAIAEAARVSLPSSSDGRPSDRPRERAGTDGEQRSGGRRTTDHWRGVGAVAMLCLGAGVLGESPALLLSGVVGVGYGAYARSVSLPAASLSVERSVSDATPDPGESVEVTVTVCNEGARTLPDVRVVDGVPGALAVVEGTPRGAAPLRPGDEFTVTYAVSARRGRHEFDPTLVLVSDLTGGIEAEHRIRAEATITCVPRLRATETPVPLRDHVTQFTGTIPTSTGGDGVEFFATREYRPGDPVHRVDWNRRARTGEFATLEFREERMATVVLVVDAREAARVAPNADEPTAADRSVDAAGRLFARLFEAGNKVGVAALGDTDCWLPPGAGRDHRTGARELLAVHPAFDPVSPGEGSPLPIWERWLRRRLTGDAQLLFVSPLVDPDAARVARQFHAYGYPVTVISPDASAGRTSGHRLSAIARKLRITGLREAGVRVVDWSWDEPLGVALATDDGRWSR